VVEAFDAWEKAKLTQPRAVVGEYLRKMRAAIARLRASE
jgi:hypothetical protein